jgi:NADH:ubiquinone reductase (H+-translocating)
MSDSQNIISRIPNNGKPRIIIIGGGFAGIQLVKSLSGTDTQIVMLDRNNYHTFQPLLYQVATSGLEPDSVAGPLRKVFENQKNFYFRMANVEYVDTDQQSVITNIGTLVYDYLVIATGTRTNFFGNENVERLSFPLKQVPQALNLRSHILQNFEKAVLLEDEEEKSRLTNFVVVGGGPTGVEVSGALGELKKHVLPKDYPEFNFDLMKIYLLEGKDKVLSGMSENASKRARQDLENKFHVQVNLNSMVDDFDGYEVKTKDGRTIPTETLIWAAGVKGVIIPGLTRANEEQSRYVVDEYNRVEGYDNVFAIGDVAKMKTGEYSEGHPQVAPVAMQMGTHLGKNISRMLRNEKMKAFSYFDKGTMATIGRNRAVVDMPNKVHFGGTIAWLIWMFIHLLYIIGFRNKLVVFSNWIWNYFTYDRGTRLIIRPFNYRKFISDKSRKIEEATT